MTVYQAAHLRLISELPVRTVEAKRSTPTILGQGYQVRGPMKRQIKRLKKQGWTNQRIADELGIARSTVGRNLREGS